MGGSDAEEVRAAIGQLIEAQNTGDAERLRTLLSERPGSVHIGTDAGEWWTSKELLDDVAASGGGDDVQVVGDEFDVHLQGDVAWVEGRGRFVNRSGGERPVRVTGVFVREHGRWAMMQSHSSIAVPNADIFS
jgi:ketosteroid isomerase-like protein